MPRTIVSPDRARAAALAAALVLGSSAATAAELKPETVAAWNAYVQATEQRIDRELGAVAGFLVIDFQPARQSAADRRALAAGDLVLASMRTRDAAGRGIDVPSGTIEHWRGAVFVPGVSVDLVMEALRSGATLEGQQDVIEARVLERRGDSMRTWLKLRRKSIVTVTYATEHAVTLQRFAPGRAASRSVSTRIAELEQAGTSAERAKPEGRDSGFLWRLNSYWRYEERSDGVVVEVESLTLSRDVPLLVSPIVSPIVNRVARESLRRTLTGLRDRLLALRPPAG